MADMLVKLCNVTPDHALFMRSAIARLAQQQIMIKRVLAPDPRRVLRFIETSAAPPVPKSPASAGSARARRLWPTRTRPLRFTDLSVDLGIGFRIDCRRCS